MSDIDLVEVDNTIDDVIDDFDVVSVETDEHKASQIAVNKSEDGKITNGTLSPVEDLDHAFKHSNDTSDLRLIVEGKPLYVSKVVLALVSPVFKRLFASHEKEGKVEMVLPRKNYSETVEFLYCVYPDKLSPVTGGNVEAMLQLAFEYEVRTLISRCQEFLVRDIEKITQKPSPEKIVYYLNISDKYGLDDLQKATFETAAKTESTLLENVQDFWELPSVTTTSVFIRRLKILEQCSRNIRTKIKEIRNHCSLYHKGEKHGTDNVCSKCFAVIGRHAHFEIKQI